MTEAKAVPIHDQYVRQILDQAEAEAELKTRADGFRAIRVLGLEDAASVLWSMPSAEYPRLSKVLPPMAPSDVTLRWTGAQGNVLLHQSLSFVRSCAANYSQISGQSLSDTKILDFGCGYGRFLRLFSIYSDQVFGVDAWEASLAHSREAGFADRVAQSDAVPTELPFSGFEFLFAFSIFTHLSKEATISALKALRKSARDGAVLVITIRPVEFWEVAARGQTHLNAALVDAGKLAKEHREKGFSYFVQGHPDTTGHHYGDTSLSIDWLLSHADGWEFAGVDRSLNDPYQRYVFLRAV